MATTNINPISGVDPAMSIDTSNLAPAPPEPPEAKGQGLYHGDTPEPTGTHVNQEKKASAQDGADPATGIGVEGELDVWDGRYSLRNFTGRIAMMVVATIAAGVFVYYIWETGTSEARNDYSVLNWIVLSGLGLFWLGLIFRMAQAHFSHHYRLTNRRLFVTTGMIHRRSDMMELLRVKDVFCKQESLMERLLDLGTVVVVPTEKELPTFYLPGVKEPKQLLDLIWHHARAERDHRSVKVDSV
jgi:membrane protein YdbS with pleckstrin-like domain